MTKRYYIKMLRVIAYLVFALGLVCVAISLHNEGPDNTPGFHTINR